MSETGETVANAPGAGAGVRHALQSAAVTTMMPPSIPVLQKTCFVLAKYLPVSGRA